METVFGFTPSNKNEENAMESIMENYPDGSIHKVVCMPNADFADPNSVPSGLVAIHPLDAEVHPDSIPNEMFEYLVVCKIHDEDLTDAKFAGKEENLASSIPQFSKSPPRLVGMRPKSGPDLDTWAPELGKNGYVGIFKQTDGRDAQYYVVARAGAPMACREFKRHVVNGERRQFKDLLLDPAFNYTKNMAKRNAERLAYCAARTLGVHIAQVPDASALAREPHIAKPYRAAPLPGCCQDISAIETFAYQGKKCAGVFHKVRSARKTSKTCFVSAGPHDGITIFNMKGGGSGVGMPVETGRGEPQKSVSESVMRKRARGFTWEARLDDHHPSLLPGAHKTIDNEFLKKMGKLGWRQEGVDNRQVLTPVIVKLGNPELERPK